jgi:hypothetical protein
MLKAFILPVLEDEDPNNMQFQKVGALPTRR